MYYVKPTLWNKLVALATATVVTIAAAVGLAALAYTLLPHNYYVRDLVSSALGIALCVVAVMTYYGLVDWLADRHTSC